MYGIQSFYSLIFLVLFLPIKIITIHIKYDIKTTSWNYLAGMKCGQQVCVGTLIKKHWILTSASCITIVQGPCYVELTFSNKDKISQLHHFDIKIIHPGYRKFLLDKYSFNDIALVKLRPDLFVGVPQGTEIVKLSTDLINTTSVCKVPNWFGENSFYETGIDPKDFNCRYFLSAVGNDQIDKDDQNLIASKDFCNKFGFIMNKVHGFEIEGSGQPLVCNGEQYAIFLNTFFIENEPNCSQWTFTYHYLDWIDNVMREYGDADGLQDFIIKKQDISAFLRRKDIQVVTFAINTEPTLVPPGPRRDLSDEKDATSLGNNVLCIVNIVEALFYSCCVMRVVLGLG